MKGNHKQRLLAVLPFLCTGIVLGVAVSLKPDPSGMGTHHQLGLNPCGFLTEIGFPCPMCGMTTSFAHYVQFQFIEGFFNQPFSSILFGLTIFVFSISFFEIIQPRDRIGQLVEAVQKYQRSLGWMLLIFMFVGWGYKIYFFSQS